MSLAKIYDKWDTGRDKEDLPTSDPQNPPAGAVKELYNLTGEQRLVKIFEMSKAGYTNSQLAKLFGVCERTITRALTKYRARFVEHLQGATAFELIAAEYGAINSIESIALTEAHAIQAAGKRYDPATRTMVDVEAQGKMSDKIKFLSLALKAGASRRNLLIETGIIRKDGDRLHGTVAKVDAEEVRKRDSSRTIDDLKAELIRTIEKCRTTT